MSKKKDVVGKLEKFDLDIIPFDNPDELIMPVCTAKEYSTEPNQSDIHNAIFQIEKKGIIPVEIIVGVGLYQWLQANFYHNDARLSAFCIHGIPVKMHTGFPKWSMNPVFLKNDCIIFAEKETETL